MERAVTPEGSSYPDASFVSLADAEDAVRVLLRFVGDDPTRPGLVDTPGRVARSLREMTSGCNTDAADVLQRIFPVHHDEIIALSGIRFTSLCEHHLLPFSGTATVAYIPGSIGVVGISKLARLVDLYARRLQVQERLTEQIATAIEVHLAAQGVGVVLKAHHSCMGCRGARQPDAQMVTSVMLGIMRDVPQARTELLSLMGTT
jgi:GTP cyclohydrolase I